MAACGPSMEHQLAEMFPHLGIDAIKDLLEQCNHNSEVALERLLEMARSDCLQRPAAAPAPAAPRTRQDALAFLFPGSSPLRGPPARLESNQNHPPDHSATLVDAVGLAGGGGGPQASVELSEICPWLAESLTLTGQGAVANGAAAVAEGPAHSLPAGRSPTAACVSRGWWPSWPLGNSHMAQSAPLPIPAPVGPSCQPGLGSWSAADDLLETTKYRTPPKSAPPRLPGSSLGSAAEDEPASSSRTGLAAAIDYSASDGTPPATPLQGTDPSLRPGTADVPVTSPGAAASPCPSDDELVALVPHLAHCLSSPSPSGTTSPVPQAAAAGAPAPTAQAAGSTQQQQQQQPQQQQQAQGAVGGQEQEWGQEQEGDLAELVQAVGFHCRMFPNLNPEVVGDVLQRYSSAQAALDQLVMLASCVESAAQCAEQAADAASLPDSSSWEVGSGSDEEGSGGWDGGGSGGVGHSWEHALTPEELSGLEQGHAPADLAELMGLPRQQQQQQQQPPQAPDDADDMQLEEKLEVLRDQFKGISGEEVAAALAACDGKLFAAADLLRSFTAEDAAAAAAGTAAVAATVPTAAVPHAAAAEPASSSSSSSSSLLPLHVRPKVAHLARRFPNAPADCLEVALQAVGYDLVLARRTLQENGYEEAEVQTPTAAAAAAAMPVPQPVARPPGLPPPPVPVPLPAPLGAAAVASGSLAGPSSRPPSLDERQAAREAAYAQNQAIYSEERATQLRLQAAYRRSFELASAHHAAGNHAMANELSQRGREYKQQYDEERRRASRRISTRINARGQLPVVKVDLHGQSVREALGLVVTGIDNLTKFIPGGVVVRYITGKGLHSEGGEARIKPAVLDLLAEQGVPHVEGPGWVEATLLPREEEA